MLKKRFFPLLLATVYLLAGCQAAFQAGVAAPPSTDIAPVPDIVEVVEIIDIANRDNIPCDQALQPFYEDETAIYSYSCIKSEYVLVKYSDGTEETVEDALKAGKISIADLDRYGIHYLTAPRSPEITPAQIEYLLAAPVLPELTPYPLDQSDWSLWQQQEQLWWEHRQKLHSAPTGYADSLDGFWRDSIAVYLANANGENAVYSPISLYMALAMLAQTTGGESRQELLELLGAESMEHLAQQAGYVFLNQYENDGVRTSILANSLWLDEGRAFHQDTVACLAERFYASVYQGPLESPELNIALQDWLNAQTGGLLRSSIADLAPMDIDTVFALASTIHYRCSWADSFSTDDTAQGIFYSPKGEQTVTYLNKTDSGVYCSGDGYGATWLPLEDGSRMWLILPDGDTNVETLLQNSSVWDMLSDSQGKSARIRLSVPKFDVSADLDLLAGLYELGVRQVQDWTVADFSGISPDPGICLGCARQGVRVSIDEEGLTGVAYTVLTMPEKGISFEEPVDFVLNRPFLFVVESPDGLPLFTGIVNQSNS